MAYEVWLVPPEVSGSALARDTMPFVSMASAAIDEVAKVVGDAVAI